MDSKFFTIMAALGLFMVMFVIITIVTYILMSIGIQRLLKNMKIENSWVCWLPIVNIYALGLLIVDKSKVPKIDLIMLLGNILAVLILLFGGKNTTSLTLFITISLTIYILFLYSIYLLYARYSPEYKILYTVLSIVFILLTPIFIFSLRNNEPEDIIMEESESTSIEATNSTNEPTIEATDFTNEPAIDAADFASTPTIEAVDVTSTDDTTL